MIYLLCSSHAEISGFFTYISFEVLLACTKPLNMSLFQHVYSIANRFPVRIVNLFEVSRNMSKKQIFIVAFFAQMTLLALIFVEFRIKAA